MIFCIIKSVNNLKYPFALILHYLQFMIITMINIGYKLIRN